MILNGGAVAAKKRCLVVGAGGAGREILSWTLQMPKSDWEVAGLLDANPEAFGTAEFPYPILGDPASWTPKDDEVFVAGLGDPAVRLRVCGDLKARGARFVTVVHPSVILALNVTIGEGCVLSPNVVVSANAVIENFVLVNIAASIGHDTRIGEGATVSCHCDVMGYAQIGRECFLGSHAAILPRKKVGDRAVVGAGSTVVRNVAAATTVMGVPAQRLSGFPEKRSA
jgi:sugar O-acyltransferase (sialic acid O-acetyltransferase NeuD family)